MTKTYKEINLEWGIPIVSEAMKKLDSEIKVCKNNSWDEFFLLNNAFMNEEDEDDEDDASFGCENCVHCDDNGWCDIKGDYADRCYDDCVDFKGRGKYEN